MGCELCRNDNRENIECKMVSDSQKPLEIKNFDEYNQKKENNYPIVEEKLTKKYTIKSKDKISDVNNKSEYKEKNNNINFPLNLNQNKNEYIINTLNIYNNNKIEYSSRNKSQSGENKAMENDTNTISNAISNTNEKKEVEMKKLKKNLRKDIKAGRHSSLKNRNKKVVIQEKKNLTFTENDIKNEIKSKYKRNSSINRRKSENSESENNSKKSNEKGKNSEENKKTNETKKIKYSYTKQISKNTEKINSLLKEIKHSKIDQILSETPSRIETTLENLINYFKKKSRKLTEIERAWLIYKWVTENIKYDLEGINAYSYDTSEEATFIRGKSISKGYVSLYKKICESLDLKVEEIEGFSKPYTFNINEENEDSEKHDWNAIQVEKEWYLIDCTWGSGYIEDNKFIKKFNPYYFSTPPQEFVRGHLPFQSKWQLLPQPKKVSHQTFMSFTPLQNEFFNLGFNSIEPDYAINDVKEKGKFSLFFEKVKDKNHEKIKVKGKLFSIEDDNNLKEIPNSILETKKEDCIEVNYLIYRKGSYNLKIFGSCETSKEYNELCTLNLNSDKDMVKQRTYPKTTEFYHKSNMEIVRPNNGTLKEGNKVTFEIKTTTYDKLYLGIITEEGDNYIEMGKSNNTFIEEDFLIYGKKVLISCKGENNNYDIILEFEVIPITKKKNTITHPIVFPGPKNKLIEPICNPLKKGKKVNFSIRGESFEEMAVFDGDEMHKLTKNNGVFTGAVKISGKGEVKIVYKKENGIYDMLYLYRVI